MPKQNILWAEKSSFVGKESRKKPVDIEIIVTPRNGDRKITQSIGITSRYLSRIGKWNQLSKFR